jgi:hypothetical protein
MWFAVAFLAQYAGNARCAECHADQGAKHSRSPHARALQAAAEEDRRLFGDATRWVFGGGHYGRTPLEFQNGRWVEGPRTWFTDTRRLDRTPGHADERGVVQSPRDAERCFSCHATGVRTGPDLSTMVAGVQCERCHGPGAAHSATPSPKNILNSGRFGAKQQVQVCGECHRTPPATGASREPELDDPLSVRFQPVGLMASACFQKSGKLSCATCHDAHAPAVRNDPAFYASKCAGCHSTRSRKCKTDCVGCHMPKSNPAPHLTFTDHRIRAY